MQLQIKFPGNNKIAKGLIAFVVIISCNACAEKVNFQTSTVVPAARGFVKVTRDNNKNYVIHLQLANLAEVDRLQTAKGTYVVWMITDKEETKNIGLLNSSTGMFSNKLTASFDTSSSTRPKQIFITAEDDGAIQYPGNEIILSTDRF